VINSLQQTILRLASPGVPDLYQGTELWDFSLVDPDNRRPVDFEKRAALLAQKPPSEFLATWRDGRVKLAIVQRMLALRAHLPELLGHGAYLPLTVQGAHAMHAIAFARRQGNTWAVVIATRVATALLQRDADVDADAGADDRAQRDTPLVEPDRWEDTAVQMPEELVARAMFDWLSPAAPKVDDNGLLYLRDALTSMPVAVLVEDGVPRA
jgi:(1->4)-alpha-D-glucan 1-alpha-D-glucosylmutase